MGYNSKHTGAEVEALLDGIGDKTKAPYIIQSFVFDDLIGDSGEIQMLRTEVQYRDISLALKEGRRILLRRGLEDDGMYGSIDTNAFEEDLIYLYIHQGADVYVCDIDTLRCAYEKVSVDRYKVREIANEVFDTSYPTEIATATQRIAVTSDIMLLNLKPNICYDWSGTTLTSLSLPSLYAGDNAYYNKWMIRVALTNSSSLTIPFDVFWRDGIAPSWSGWAVCEITFTKDAIGDYTYGEWKIFK